MLFSDNGSTFMSAAKIIQEIVQSTTVTEHLSELKIKWSFNIEKAPWWGSTFERMIGLTK